MSMTTRPCLVGLVATLCAAATVGCGAGSLATDGRGPSDATTPDADSSPEAPQDRAPDIANGDGGCTGDAPLMCVMGGGIGGAIVCDDVLSPATCVGGQWTCPVGSIDPGLCRCDGAPAPGCTCTKQGWSCRDGGTDADATDSDSSSCIGDAPLRCVEGGPMGDVIVCSDVSLPASCKNGQWTCGGGFVVEISSCTCSGAVPTGCHCTVGGWVCTEGGADGPHDAAGNAS